MLCTDQHTNPCSRPSGACFASQVPLIARHPGLRLHRLQGSNSVTEILKGECGVFVCIASHLHQGALAFGQNVRTPGQLIYLPFSPLFDVSHAIELRPHLYGVRASSIQLLVTVPAAEISAPSTAVSPVTGTGPPAI
jgi:hypothetical protein